MVVFVGGLVFAHVQFKEAKRQRDLKWMAELEARIWTYKKIAEQGDAEAQNRLGNSYLLGQEVAKNPAEAVKWFRLAAEQGNVDAGNNLAWILAVSNDAALRNGKEAVKWATKICVATGYGDWQKLDTLAAAFAEAGEFQKAVEYQQMALDRCKGPVDLRTAAQERLKLYQQGKPFRE